jgi:hypothetical protein
MSSEVSKQTSCTLCSFNSGNLYVVLLSLLLLLAFLSVLYSFHPSDWKTNGKIFWSWMIKNVQILNLLVSPVNVSRSNSSLGMESKKQCCFQSSIWKRHISTFNLHTLSYDFLLKRMWYYTDIYWDNTSRRWDKKGDIACIGGRKMHIKLW